MEVLFAVAAATLIPLLVRAVLATYPLYALPDLVFHSTHLSKLPTATALVKTGGLLLLVRAPAALLVLIEPKYTRNTGDVGGAMTAEPTEL
jgi:hypothetical protein